MNQENNQTYSKRRNTRILAVCVMYSLEVNKNLFTEEDKTLILEQSISDVLAMSQTEFLSDEFPTLFSLEYLKELTSKCYFEIKSIDEIISNSLVKYTIDRLSYVDRAIVRIAVTEMLLNNTPKNIIINEAIEITKELTSIEEDSQVKFNNKLLDNIAGKIYGK